MGIVKRCISVMQIGFHKAVCGSGLTIEKKQRRWDRGIFFDIAKGGHIRIGSGAWIRHDAQFWCAKGAELEIGKNVFINTGVIISARQSIRIGDGTGLGPNVMIYDHEHDFSNLECSGFVEKGVTIGRNVWVLSNVCILNGVTIGDNSVIGAGVIVDRDIPPNSFVTAPREMKIKERRYAET